MAMGSQLAAGLICCAGTQPVSPAVLRHHLPASTVVVVDVEVVVVAPTAVVLVVVVEVVVVVVVVVVVEVVVAQAAEKGSVQTRAVAQAACPFIIPKVPKPVEQERFTGCWQLAESVLL